MRIQTGLMTSPARNILGLCKKGRIGKTSVAGSVSFFGIDSENDTEPVQIEVEYAGDSYIGNQVHYTTNNGSWRLNFYGETDEGKKFTDITRPQMGVSGARPCVHSLMEKNIFSHRDTECTEVFTEKKKYFCVSSPALRDKLCILCLCGHFMLDVPTDGLSFKFCC